MDAQCSRIGSSVDPSIKLSGAGPGRSFVASADDSSGVLTDARFLATLPEDGDYVVEISDSSYKGGARPVYRLVIGAVPMVDEVYPLGGRTDETTGFELRGGTLNELALVASNIPSLGEARAAWLRVPGAMLHPASKYDVESLGPLAVSRAGELREPTDPRSGPVRGAAPVVFNGRLEIPGDEDRFKLAVAPGERLNIKVEASELGSKLDGVLTVIGPKGDTLATADDTTIPIPGAPQNTPPIIMPDPSLAAFAVPAGVTELTFALRDLQNRGGIGYGYRIRVAPFTPGFELVPNDTQISIPNRGTAAIGVTVARREFNAPITVTIKDPPAGVTVRPGTIADGQTIGALSVSLAPNATLNTTTLQLVATAQGPAAPIESLAVKKVVYASQGNLPTNFVVFDGLAASDALPQPVKLDAPATVIDIAHGQTANIPVTAVRDKGADAALTFATLPLAAGWTAPGGTIAAKANLGNAVVAVAPEFPLGPTTIALTAKANFGKGDQILAIPAVTLRVVRPVSVTLAAPAVDLKIAGSAEIKGKIARQGGFKEPVTVTVAGLPATIKVAPVTIAANAIDFAIKLNADAKAAAGAINGNVTVAIKIAGKDYATPPLPVSVKIAK